MWQSSYISLCKRRHERKLARFCVKTSLFSYLEMLTPLSKVIVFLCYFLEDEVFFISLLNGCYHYLVLMDPVNGCSKSKLLVKE